jgi:hypothetical protein
VNRESILSAKTIQTEAVEVPEYGGTVYLRGLNAADRVAFFDSIDQETESPTRIGCKLIARCMVDADGTRLLTDDDAAALEAQDGKLIDRLANAANKVNGIGTEAEAAAAKK